MSTPKYIIAQYTPDRMRKEPRNVGIVLWTPAGVSARFFAEKESSPGEINGRRLGKRFVITKIIGAGFGTGEVFWRKGSSVTDHLERTSMRPRQISSTRFSQKEKEITA